MTCPIAWYISGHGFGHASRQTEIINSLRERRLDVPVLVRTAASKWLLDLTLRSTVDLQPAECDTGVVQVDSLRLDEAETLDRAARFYRDFERRVTREAELLRRSGARLVIGDIPPLAFAAAERAGVPSIAISNFTWDWIYEGYAPEEKGLDWLVPLIREATGRASSFMRLPMWGGFEMAPPEATLDLPLVARRSSKEPADVRRALGLPLDRKLVLLSFGGHGLHGATSRTFAGLGEEYVAIVTGHLELSALARSAGSHVIEFDEQAMYARGWRYEDLVAAVDVVLTKPGYGIVAECAANFTALLYTSRGHFVEYEVLVQEMPQYVRSQFIPQEALFAGDWVPYLDELLAQDMPEPQPADGADVAATKILEKLQASADC